MEGDLPIFFEHQRDPAATSMAACAAREWDAFMSHWRNILGDRANEARTILVDDQVAGYVASWERDGKRLVGYWVGREHWGRGVARSALDDFLRTHEHHRPVHAYVALSNVRSIRVLEKCGFQRVGEPVVGSDGVAEVPFLFGGAEPPGFVSVDAGQRLQRVRAVRATLHANGPERTRPFEDDFERVALPASDCDILRDALIAHKAHVVVEVGLAYGSSALAIGEALCSSGAADISHIVIDPFQATAYDNVGRDALEAAELGDHTIFFAEASSIVLARLAAEGFRADAAFVDGSHRFHEVFVDLYFLRSVVRPGGLIILDDAAWPSVATALRYFDRNLGWRPMELAGRLAARRLPEAPFEPAFTDFKPF